MKAKERQHALELLERHPGWSDRRVADEVGVAHSTIARWRRWAALPGALERVRDRRRRHSHPPGRETI